MREIKLKFAGQLQEKWIISRPFTLGELNIGWVSQFAANENLKMGHLIPLQFTGIKDKQGKEIYEGDILKRVNGQNDLVEFEDGHFVVRHPHGDADFIARINSFEIIGNIYENPELLKSRTEPKGE